MNWIWDEVPFIDGYKGSHMVLLLAVVDSINRNRWSKTSIPYDYLINKCKFSKQVYLDARKWLVDNLILEVQTGKNGYQMATFYLGVAVRNQTAIITGSNTATMPAADTTTRPLLVPIIKQETVKEKLETVINISFETFWNAYEKKVGEIKKLKKKWAGLKDEERRAIMDYLPAYIKAQPDKQYRKNPETFLNNRSWEDEIIDQNSEKHATNQKTVTAARGSNSKDDGLKQAIASLNAKQYHSYTG